MNIKDIHNVSQIREKNSKWVDLPLFCFQILIPPALVLLSNYKSCSVLSVCVCPLCLSMSQSGDRDTDEQTQHSRNRALRHRAQDFIREDRGRQLKRGQDDRCVKAKAAETRVRKTIKAERRREERRREERRRE